METLLENDLVGKIGIQKYKCTITWRNGEFIMGEPPLLEGKNLGPDPFTTLLASLAGCTLSTLRMYIDRKGWDIPEIFISLNIIQETNLALTTTISRTITFSKSVEEDIKNRLLVIADKCPVSKILKNEIVITITL